VDSENEIIREIKREYREILEEIQVVHNGDNSGLLSAAVRNRREVLGKYKALWNEPTVSSHGTRLSCLFGTPNHVIPCGHAVCNACVDDFSEANGLRRTIKNCPLCTRCTNQSDVSIP
jgi:hypothetical protein